MADGAEKQYLCDSRSGAVRPHDQRTRLLDESERSVIVSYLRHSPLAAIEWCPDRTVRLWNAAAERIFGYTAGELEGVDVFPLIVSKESQEQVDHIWSSLLAGTGGQTSINANVTKSGRVIQCRWNNAQLVDDSGRVIGVTSFVEDITDRVHAHRAAIETTERLQRVIAKLPVLLWAFDPDGKPVLWNEQAEVITGYPASRIIGNEDFLSVVHAPEEKARFLTFWEGIGFGDFDEVEVAATCADGSVRRILLSNISSRCPIPGWSAWGIGVDVTDRFKAFEALRQSERQFRDIIQSVDLAGLVVDETGLVTFCNQAFLRLARQTEAGILGKNWADLLGPSVGSAPVIPVGGTTDDSCFRTRIEGVLTTAEGNERTLAWTRSLLRDAEGGVSGAVALGLDMTDQRRAEAELKAYRDQLEDLVDQRTAALAESERRLQDAERLASLGRFAAGLNHDLGNVLLPVRCHLDTLLGADLDTRCSDAVKAIAHGVGLLEHLEEGLALVGGTSEFSKPNSAEMITELDPHEWWADARGLLERVIPAEVDFEARFDPELPAVFVSSHHLTRAIMNLMVNAVEATTRGGNPSRRIWFTVRFDETMRDIEFRVDDNGPGVTEGVERRAAEPFFSTKPRSLSTGLGLSIVNAVAKLARGSFRLGNGPREGASAVIRLPLANSSSSDATRVALVIRNARIRAACTELVHMLGGCVVEPETADVMIAERDGSIPTPGASELPVTWIEPGAVVGGIQRIVRDALRLGQGRRRGST